jgi:hypothetical protein
LDDIEPEQPLIWVEGELDKLALEVAGFRNVVSVPNGAPPPEAKNYAALFKFLDADSAKIQSVQRHILAGDSDIAGVRLETELSRRLGIEKCSRVRWPAGVKDANEMLIKHGPPDLAWYIENAEPYPIEGVFEIPTRRCAATLRAGFRAWSSNRMARARQALHRPPGRIYRRHRHSVLREIKLARLLVSQSRKTP